MQMPSRLCLLVRLALVVSWWWSARTAGAAAEDESGVCLGYLSSSVGRDLDRDEYMAFGKRYLRAAGCEERFWSLPFSGAYEYLACKCNAYRAPDEEEGACCRPGAAVIDLDDPAVRDELCSATRIIARCDVVNSDTPPPTTSEEAAAEFRSPGDDASAAKPRGDEAVFWCSSTIAFVASVWFFGGL